MSLSTDAGLMEELLERCRLASFEDMQAGTIKATLHIAHKYLDPVPVDVTVQPGGERRRGQRSGQGHRQGAGGAGPGQGHWDTLVVRLRPFGLRALRVGRGRSCCWYRCCRCCRLPAVH